MIVFGVAEGGDRILEIVCCDVLVAEPELGAFGEALAARVLSARPGAVSPESPWRGAGPADRCCMCELATGREISMAGAVRGYGDNLMLSRGVLVFAESERARLCSFLKSQAKRADFGPPYGGDHYRDFHRGGRASAGDLVVWVSEGERS